MLTVLSGLAARPINKIALIAPVLVEFREVALNLVPNGVNMLAFSLRQTVGTRSDVLRSTAYLEGVALPLKASCDIERAEKARLGELDKQRSAIFLRPAWRAG